jgi:hypothetical protein
VAAIDFNADINGVINAMPEIISSHSPALTAAKVNTRQNLTERSEQSLKKKIIVEKSNLYLGHTYRHIANRRPVISTEKIRTLGCIYSTRKW